MDFLFVVKDKKRLFDGTFVIDGDDSDEDSEDVLFDLFWMVEINVVNDGNLSDVSFDLCDYDVEMVEMLIKF